MPTNSSWIPSIVIWGVAFIWLIVIIVYYFRRGERVSSGDVIQPIIMDKSLEVNVSKYSLVDWVQKYETLLLEVELTMQVSQIPTQIATLKLCIGQDQIDPTSPILPIKIESSPSSYLVKYEISVPLLVENEMHDQHADMTHLCVFAMGQEWLSNKFTIPYELP